MMSGWSRLRRGEGGSSSNSARSNDIDPEVQITEAVYKLRDPAEPLEVDIVFIHGLQLSNYEDAYRKTWTAGENDDDGREICWPQSWLGEDIPAARIWSLSYDSCAIKTSTTGRIDIFLAAESLVQQMVEFAEIGQRDHPVVLVCHCLGGLVAKEIVSKAHGKFGNDPKYKRFLGNLRGFFFYGTPHHGSKLADLAKHLPNVGTLVVELEVINERLERLNEEFQRIGDSHYANRWKFAVVAETHKTRFGEFRATVVKEGSARHVYNNFLPVAADHFEICKPKSKKRSSYVALRRFIEEVVEYHKQTDVVFKLPSLMVGKDRLQDVRQRLKVHPAVGLVGMGGIGKTTLSECFYNEEKKNYEKSCFLEEVKYHNVRASQKQLFRDLCGAEWKDDSVGAQLEMIRRCIVREKVLLVVDDVGNEKEVDVLKAKKVDVLKALKVDAFKDGTGGSKVIVTTRQRDMLNDYVGEEAMIDVEGLEEAEALRLFSHYAFDGCDESARVELDDLAKEITEACGGLPLSLEVMGQFLKKYNRRRYVEDRMEAWKKALGKLREAQSLNGDPNDRLWATLKISYEGLDKHHQSMFLDFACIMCEIIRIEEGAFRYVFNDEKGFLNKQKLGRVWGDPLGVKTLIDRSIIKCSNEAYLVMHDQLRDLGRSIVKDLANGNSEDMNRILEQDEVRKLTQQDRVSRSVEGVLMLEPFTASAFPFWKFRIASVEASDSDDDDASDNDELRSFKRLRLLNLQGSRDIRLVEYYMQSCLEKLTWLCLNGTEVTCRSIKRLGSFEELRVLQMQGCWMLEDIPRGLGELSLLMELDLSCCQQLTRLPDEIGKLGELQVLELEGCEVFVSLPTSIGELKSLRRLNCGACFSLEDIPASVGELRRLENLSFFMCVRVKTIEFGTRMDNLKELYLTCCEELETIKSFENLRRLKRLFLVGCVKLCMTNLNDHLDKLATSGCYIRLPNKV